LGRGWLEACDSGDKGEDTFIACIFGLGQQIRNSFADEGRGDNKTAAGNR